MARMGVGEAGSPPRRWFWRLPPWHRRPGADAGEPSLALSRLGAEQQFLVLLALLAAVAITPFGLWRFWSGDLVQGLIDVLIVATLAIVAALGTRERYFRLASALFSLFYTVGVALVVARLGPDALYWVFPAATAVFFVLRAREALVLSLIGMVANTTLAAMATSLLETATFAVTNFLVCLFSYLFASRMWSANRRLTVVATADALTGAGNRRLLDDTLQQIAAGPGQGRHTMLMLDIDHFKQINDHFGHATGDVCLQRLARAVNETLQPGQKLYRFGGEEFVILIEGTLAQGAILAELIRVKVERQRLLREQAITVSLGVAELGPGQTQRDWLKVADGALYQAKTQGRNRVIVASRPGQ